MMTCADIIRQGILLCFLHSV